jgi:Domain of unknown function (DUF6268)
MPPLRPLTFALALLTASTSLRAIAAELIDPAALGFGPPSFTLDTTYQGTLDYEDGSGGLETFEMRTVVPFAKWRSGDWLFGSSLKYSWTHADFGPAQNLGMKELHKAEVQLFAAWQVKDSPWWALGFVTPGVATDFQDLGSDGLTASGLALLGYRWSPTLDFAVGAFANYSLGEATALGAIGFIWQPNDRWIVQATPPILAIGWRPSREWTVGVVSYPSGGGWEVGEDGDAVRQVDLSLWRAALSVERRFGDHWRVSARAGVAFGGELELRDAEARVISDTDLDPAPFGAVAVKWAF